MISRIFYICLMGIIGAAIVHLTIIFLLPSLSANNVWRLVADRTEIGIPISIDSSIADEEQNLFLDPLFQAAACRYDLAEGIVRVTASGDTPLWTVAVFDTSGTVIFSANDRIADSPVVDLAIVNPAQLRFARQNTPDELAQSLIAAADQNEGFVLVRVYAPDSSWESSAKEFLDSMQCEFLAY